MSDTIKTDVTTEQTVTNTAGDNQETGNQSQDGFKPSGTQPNNEELLKGFRSLQSKVDAITSAKDKAEAELKKMKEASMTARQLEELRAQEYAADIAKREEALKKETLNFQKVKLLNEKQWDADMLDLVYGDNVESFSENVQKLNEKIKKYVEKEVNARLASGNPTPAAGKQGGEDVFTVEEINTLPKTKGTEWTKLNLEKLQRSIKFWNK